MNANPRHALPCSISMVVRVGECANSVVPPSFRARFTMSELVDSCSGKALATLNLSFQVAGNREVAETASSSEIRILATGGRDR